jgi:hypothetical protein
MAKHAVFVLMDWHTSNHKVGLFWERIRALRRFYLLRRVLVLWTLDPLLPDHQKGKQNEIH